MDAVFECSGVFLKKEQMEKHLQAGAAHVVLSAPPKSEGVPMVVHGANDPEEFPPLVSCASCTTNCITPVMEILNRRIGVEKATMTTIHAYTSSQSVVDTPASKHRRGRAAAMNFVPTSTGAAEATAKCLPAFEGKFSGIAIRGPVICGSVADIVCVTGRETSAEEVNGIFREEARGERYMDKWWYCARLDEFFFRALRARRNQRISSGSALIALLKTRLMNLSWPRSVCSSSGRSG